MELILATHNQHKVKELQKMLPEVTLKSLSDINFTKEIQENGRSFEENACIKSKTIYNQTHKNILSDDSGLVIPALDGEPGIYSARYAGTGDDNDNIKKVLSKMKNIQKREAYFVCVLSLIINGAIHIFEGKCEGFILTAPTKSNGFGYDPIFKPKGYTQSFAEMNPDIKNKISHRAVAANKLSVFIKNLKDLNI